MAQMTLEELEAALGPASEFIPSYKTRGLLAQWALAIGTPPLQVYAMSPVDLTNLYHEKGDRIKNEATELQRIAADIFTNILHAVQSDKVDPDFMRDMIRLEIENLPTRKIEIIGLPQSVILDGPQHEMTETILRICSIGHAIMMVGPAGCGKTTIGQRCATALSLPFFITSTINETHELTGFIDGHGYYHRTPFRDAFEHGGVWVADEIDAWDAAALLAANSALANGFAVFPDSPVPVMRHPMFRPIAAANTFGNGADAVYIGRNQLDAASLDRFAMVRVDYDLQLERMFCGGNTDWLQYVWNIRKQVTELKIRHVVSSRAIIMGAQALSVGLPRETVEAAYLWKGMSSKDRDKINS